MNDITFEQAFRYIHTMTKYVKLSKIAEETKISRTTLSACFNGTKNRYGNPSELPKKHYQTIINLAKSWQMGEILKSDNQD